ncbi:hypothetical protein GCM10022211_26410 [Sphingomonas humi]|uniref:Transferrin-binding protein B C-lobe/N-lobe beta barrel domain-containing protein n=1 Tax=Sphingomonas humi TaxID=335630 RepID=A0ABP7SER7_9SPHN
MPTPRNALVVTSILSLGLMGCGGGGSAAQVASIPAPPPAAPPPPTSPPTPPVPPPLPAGLIGLQSDKPFSTVSALTDGGVYVSLPEPDAVHIRYSAADGLYTMTLANMSREGQLAPIGGNGSFHDKGWINISSTRSDLLDGKGPQKQGVIVTLDWPASSVFRYTNFGQWNGGCPMGCNIGMFAYGIPTSASHMPVTGSASFDGEIRGYTSRSEGYVDVLGYVTLNFDFGAGKLAGVMRPEAYFTWDPTPLGDYVFRDTVYAKGSTKFSGAFNVPGSTAPSSFTGSFTGPSANELMAQWQAPFVRPGTTETGQMVGVWIAQRSK